MDMEPNCGETEDGRVWCIKKKMLCNSVDICPVLLDRDPSPGKVKA